MTAYIINALINKGIPAKVARQIVLEKVLGRHIPEEDVNDLIESLIKELNKNMNMKKKTENRGGPRPNSGAKKKGSAARIKVSFTLEPECKEFLNSLALDQGITRSDWLNQLIRELMD